MKKIRFFIFKNLKAKRLFFLCQQTELFIKYFPFTKGNGQLFSLPKRKKLQKRSWQTCGLIAGAYGNCKPQSPLALRESVPMAHVSLDARVLRRERFFGELLIVWKLFFWCAYGMKIPPRAYFSPTKLVQQICCRFFYEGSLQKPIGG
ncbi:MAG: hypothetical protein IJD59_04015 [Clostridia bacterium]|nr:hypothetical protein [Clostridia bacterium]